ncbi:hypothetical protein bcgnr5411_41930 [Bacillus cereus]
MLISITKRYNSNKTLNIYFNYTVNRLNNTFRDFPLKYIKVYKFYFLPFIEKKVYLKYN